MFYFRCLIHLCDCQNCDQWHGWSGVQRQKLSCAEKWFPCMICVSNIPPAFLPHFLSDILLLTIFVTGGLRPWLWCEDAPEEKSDEDKITSASEKPAFSQLFCSWRKRPLEVHIPSNHIKNFSKDWCGINILFRGLNWSTIMKRRRRRNIEAARSSQCQIIIFLSNTELDEKQVFDNNRSVLPPALSNNTGQMTVSCGWAALFQNDEDDKKKAFS